MFPDVSSIEIGVLDRSLESFSIWKLLLVQSSEEVDGLLFGGAENVEFSLFVSVLDEILFNIGGLVLD